ncbi:protein NYNRIN-like [Watersipora subatra]|uniref:protein NYNRIN-like n=1 Tax=Watersipora subatra TaxID=2589382 RepID=UPI00355C2114
MEEPSSGRPGPNSGPRKDKEAGPRLIQKGDPSVNKKVDQGLGQHPPIIEKRPSAQTKAGEIVALQKRAETAIGKIYQAVLTGRPIDAQVLQLGDPELKRLANMFSQLRIDLDGVLTATIPGNGRSKAVTVCPLPVRQDLIWETHRQAHSGVDQTLKRVQLDWYWPGMTSDVRRTVMSCEVCQQAKHGTGATTSNRQRLYASRPWQRLAVDLVGPLPLTTRGNIWALVMTDHFTRWSVAIAIPDATAPTVASTLEERVFSYFGLPEIIYTDQGPSSNPTYSRSCVDFGESRSQGRLHSGLKVAV